MDGLDQGVVFLGGLGRHTEAVVVEATEVGGVADEDAMVVDEPFLQMLLITSFMNAPFLPT